MNKLTIPEHDAPFIAALRSLIRTGVMAAPGLEDSPLIDLPIVLERSGPDATTTKRAYVFCQVLRQIIQERLTGKESRTAAILFGIEEHAGVPIQDRYQAVAKLYNPYWTWENYRKEPLTRHLLTIYLALKRELDLIHEPSRKKILIIQNITREGPGLLERLLHEVAVDYEVVDLHKGHALPDPTNYAALVVLGGPDSANDNTSKMINELDYVKKAFEAGIPYLGVCLGLQIAVKVLGGTVVKSPVKEVGLRSPDGTPYSVSLTNLALTALGKKDPLFVGLKNHFRVFQLHGETVNLTTNMQLLAVGQDCPNQIVKFGPTAYGIQSHFELTKDMLQEWLRADPDLTPLDTQKVMAEFNEIEEVYTITGLSLLRNFLHIAGVVS